jgi:predicted lactoylglutathione lyase
MVETKLEVVVLPVSDVDRAKKFYEALGMNGSRTRFVLSNSSWATSRPDVEDVY